MEAKDGWRLYGFVMYNLSGIQKGIQFGHAALEYAAQFGNTPEYKEFILNHKTFIILDGGGSVDMIKREQELVKFGFLYSIFNESDLNMSMSAIVFLVPEAIYDFRLTENDANDELKGLGMYHDSPDRKKYEYLRKFRLASN